MIVHLVKDCIVFPWFPTLTLHHWWLISYIMLCVLRVILNESTVCSRSDAISLSRHSQAPVFPFVPVSSCVFHVSFPPTDTPVYNRAYLLAAYQPRLPSHSSVVHSQSSSALLPGCFGVFQVNLTWTCLSVCYLYATDLGPVLLLPSRDINLLFTLIFLVIFQAKGRNIWWFQLLKCEDLPYVTSTTSFFTTFC